MPKSFAENCVKGISVVSAMTGMPCWCAIAVKARTSTTSSWGFVMISRNKQHVLSSINRSTASTSVRSQSLASTPNLLSVDVSKE